MSKKIAIAKTILSIISLIDEFCEHVKKVTQFQSIKSLECSYNTERLFEKMIAMTIKAHRLRKLKSEVLKQLHAMPPKQRTVVMQCYVEKKPVQVIAGSLNVTERTAYRLINQGVENFACRIEKMGLGRQEFEQLIKQHRWIRAEFIRQIKAR